jgi:electron transfer flavoprotein alpha subunit
MGDVLVFAEYQHDHFPKATLVAINAALEMAKKRSGKTIAVVVGEVVDKLSADAARYGVSKVVALEAPQLKNYLQSWPRASASKRSSRPHRPSAKTFSRAWRLASTLRWHLTSLRSTTMVR